MPWFVSFETRNAGAIGVFEKRGLSSTAVDKENAMREVFDALVARGYEIRFPVDAYQYQENEES